MKDLHIHTKYSDGQYDENEIVGKVVEAGIDEFAICDHDTVCGSMLVQNVIKSKNLTIKFHSGVEFTSRFAEFGSGINCHLLARDFDYQNEGLQQLLSKISYFRDQKIALMVDLVKKTYNFDIDMREVEEVKKTTKTFGKPHIYAILSRHIECDRVQFYKNMDKLKSEHLKLNGIEVIGAVHKAGGNVTLAHPIEIMKEHNFSYDDIDKFVEYLSKLGLDGLETRHSSQTKKGQEIFSAIAKKYNLFESCGSDFHGPSIKPDVKLGVCEKF